MTRQCAVTYSARRLSNQEHTVQRTISRSFRLRLMALVLFGILPPLWGAIGYASYRAANIFRAEAQDSMAIKAEALSARVNQWHETNVLMLDELSAEADFASMERSQQLPDMLSALQSRQNGTVQTGVETVVTVDLNGEVVADVSANPRTHGNYRHQAWFQSAVAGKGHSRVVRSANQDDSKVVFSKPIVAQPTLKLGDRTPEVARLQTRLQALGYYSGPIDGIYADHTANAIHQLRQAYSLGNADSDTSGTQVDTLTWQSIEFAEQSIAQASASTGFAPKDAPVAGVEGVVMMEAQLDEIKNAVTSVQVGEQGYALVFDEQGKMLVHSDSGPAESEPPRRATRSHTSPILLAVSAQSTPHQQVSESASEPVPEQISALPSAPAFEAVQSTYQQDVQLPATSMSFSSRQADLLATVEAIPQLRQGKTGALDFADSQGEPWIAHGESLANGWSVVLLQPRADFSQQATLFRHLSLLTGAIALLATSAAISILSAKLTRPILRLSSAATAISLGHLDQKIVVESQDEIGTLATAFNSVTDQLQFSFHQLADQNEALKRLDQLKDQFLANTSHELKTPLNGMIGIAESLLDGAAGTLTDVQKQNVAMIASSSHRLTRLVNDILDFSKLQHQQLPLYCKSLGIFASVNVVLTLSRTLVQGKPILLKNNIASDFPRVYADENRIQQILLNLVSNAIKFTEKGEVTVTAELLGNNGEGNDKTNDARFVAVSVTDTGIGIAPQRIKHVFQPFQQVENSSNSYGGTGLGLSITQHLVSLHGGKIWVRSALGEGSTFTFTLPVASGGVVSAEDAKLALASRDLERSASKKGELTQLRSLRQRAKLSTTLTNVFNPKKALSTDHTRKDASATRTQSMATCPNLDPHKFNILVVDDEPINVQVLNNHLSSENYTVTHALNGADALALLTPCKQLDARANTAKSTGKSNPDASPDMSFGTSYIPTQTFDLVVLDVMMPRMSGYEVCQQLRELYPAHELPVVMLTAKNQISDLVTGFHFGANDYMTKPFSKDELLTRIRAHLRLSKTSHSYGRFVPNEYLRFLKKESIVDVRLGDHVSKEMAVMFSDIRSFTTLSEKMTPQENFDFVNAYLRQVSPVIRDQNGFIVKYLGDGMMAVFPEGVDDAIAAGIAKLRSVAALNQESRSQENRSQESRIEENRSQESRSQENLSQPIAVGIGIHFGHMMVGMVGESARMQGDAFSDNVNLTARLESLTKLYGVSLIISDQALAHLSYPERYQIHFLDRVVVKGRCEPIDIYHVLDGEPAHVLVQFEQVKDDFDQGIGFYRLGAFEQAKSCFEKILKTLPNNKTAKIYCHRLDRLRQAPPEHWNGVWTLTEK